MQDCNCGRFLFQIRAGEYELTELARDHIISHIYIFIYICEYELTELARDHII